MPEKWIESAGPNENVVSKNAFEKWFAEYWHQVEDDYGYVKTVAWEAWEYQRQRCSALIVQILDTIKESH